MTIKARDLIERVVWSAVAAAAGNLIGATAFGVTAWKAAALAALVPTVNAVLVIARWKLSVLPDPGSAVYASGYAKALADVNAIPDAATTPKAKRPPRKPSPAKRS